MGLDPTSSMSTNNWNYSNPEKPNYSLKLLGTVVSIQEVQAMNFGANGTPTSPKFWPDTNQPVMNIRMVFAGPSGGFRSWTFQPAGKAAKEGKKPSVHLDLFALTGNTSMGWLLGKTLEISTEAPPAGFNYGKGNPRPWKVRLVEDQGPFTLAEPLPPLLTMPVVLANTAVSGGMVQPTAQAQTAAQTQPVHPVAGQANVAPGAAQPVAGAYDDDMPF